MTIGLVISLILALLGLAGTWLKYRLDPKQKIYAQLDILAKQKITLERQRDEALVKNDTDALTIAGNALFQLQLAETGLLRRLADVNRGG